MAQFLKVTLKKSGIGALQKHKDTLRGLGLRRLHQVNILQDTPPIRGMVKTVSHLVQWEQTSSAELPAKVKSSTYVLGTK